MKNLSEYLGLKYNIDIIPIPENLGGGYRAVIPDLGEYAFIGDGETPEEALESLNNIKEELFKEYIQKDIDIPEPKEDYSGKFIVRVPKDLHERLVHNARRNGTSLNLYVNYLLTIASVEESLTKKLDQIEYKIEIFTESYKEITENIKIIGFPKRSDMFVDLYNEAA